MMEIDKTTVALRLLCNGFKEEFIEQIYSDERFTEFVMHKAAEFIHENIPLVNEENTYDLALMLMETVKLGCY